jgi:hypothetical protein
MFELEQRLQIEAQQRAARAADAARYAAQAEDREQGEAMLMFLEFAGVDTDQLSYDVYCPGLLV